MAQPTREDAGRPAANAIEVDPGRRPDRRQQGDPACLTPPGTVLNDRLVRIAALVFREGRYASCGALLRPPPPR